MGALFLVVSTQTRASVRAGLAPSGLLAWIGKYQASGICKHIYPRVGRGAVAVFEVEANEVLHRILNEWADIMPAGFDLYPLVELGDAQNAGRAARRGGQRRACAVPTFAD